MFVISVNNYNIKTKINTSGLTDLQKKILLTQRQVEKMGVTSKSVFERFNKNGKEAVTRTQQLEAELKDINTQLLRQYNLQGNADKTIIKGLKERQKLANAELQTMKAVNNAHKQGLTDIITKVAKFATATAIIGAFTGGMYKALDVMKQVDSELAEIGKVLDTPINQLTALRDASYEVASAMGVSATRYLEAVTAFTRAGYQGSSDELAKLSIKTQIAGDLTADLANDFILAADKAYGLEGNIASLSNVVDMSNQITNRNALELKDLTAGFKVAGSQAAQMGLDVEETNAAIGTMVAVTRQGGNIAGRALKGILMNIQQVKGVVDEETGDFIDEESLSKSSKALDAVGIATKEYRDGVLQLRDPMQILDELATKWDTLTTVQQSTLVEGIAGKYRSNQFVALMSNWDLYNKMLTDQVGATGSAADEVAIYLDSWEGRTEKLTNTWVEFVAKTADAEGIKGLISALTTVIDVVDNLGNAIVVATGALIFFKREAIAGTIIELNKFKLASLGAAGAIGLITMALGVGFMAYAQYNEAQAKAKQDAIDLGNKTRDEISAIQSLSEQYTELANKVNLTGQDKQKLSAMQDALVSQYGVEKGALDLLNGSYENNIILIQKATEAKRIAAAKEMEIEAAKAQKFISTSKTNYNLKKLGIDATGLTPIEQRIAIQRKIDEMKSITPTSEMGATQLAAIGKLQSYFDELDGTISSNMDVIYQYNALMSGDFSRFNLGGSVQTGDATEPVIESYGGSSGAPAKDAEDALKKIKEALDEYLKSLEHELFLLEKRGATEEERIEMMRKIQQTIHNQANYYRSLGLSETSSEIQQLQKMWWSYADTIEQVNKTRIQSQIENMTKSFAYMADRANSAIDKLQKKRSAEIEMWDARIEALRNENSELEENIELQKAQEALAKAKSTKVRVYREGQGFVYENDITAVSEARENLNKINREQQLRDEIERLERLKKSAVSNIDSQIEAWEDYKLEWESVAKDYEKTQNNLLVNQTLGINLENANWDTRLGNARNFVNQYLALMAQLAGQQAVAGAGGASGGGSSSGYNAYTITTQKGQDIAKNLGAGQTYKASDGSTWKKNSDGSLSVTTKSGNTYAGKYATGTTSASAGMANVDEQGKELILRRPSSGRMTYMEHGDGVVPSNLTKNLMNWGRFNPKAFVSNLAGAGSDGTVNYTIRELVLPNVKSAEDLVYGLANLKNTAIQMSKGRK